MDRRTFLKSVVGAGASLMLPVGIFESTPSLVGSMGSLDGLLTDKVLLVLTRAVFAPTQFMVGLDKKKLVVFEDQD